MTKNQNLDIPNEIVYHFQNPILNILLSKTRKALYRMISSNKQLSLILDMGCSEGTFTRFLSQMHEIIGLDIDKNKIKRAKYNFQTIDFICADIHHLPIKDDSADLVICSSVLEFTQNLETAVREIRRVLKNHGILVVGFPINNRFLSAMMGIFGKNAVKTWIPLKVLRYKDYITDPDTHKQNFQSIRSTLAKYFLMLERRKIPLSCLPDFLSFYECVKLIKIKK